MGNQTFDRSRRRFMSGIGATAVASATGPVIVGSARANTVNRDERDDLVIVGSGFAGLSPGIEAKRRAARGTRSAASRCRGRRRNRLCR